MRMWMADPAGMCRQHLLGEHVELHMFMGAMRNGVRMTGYLRDNLMEPASMAARHDALVAEMLDRGYNHKSPFPAEDQTFVQALLHADDYATVIDKDAARAELVRRCPECRDRHHALESMT